MQLVQITDSHLLTNPEGKLKGIHVEESFLRVFELIKQHETPDAIILTGDISENGCIESYQRIKNHLSYFHCPFLWIPGNHDISMNMANVFGRMLSKTILGNWKIVLLDTTIPGKPHGYMNEEKLIDLNKQLSGNNNPTLIALHHHPHPMKGKHIDEYCLKNSKDFWSVVQKHSCTKAVIWGHVHQEFTGYVNDVLCMATPSTSFQIKPGCEDFEMDTVSPGYRWINLKPDGSVETKVKRVAH